jgi:two-component system, chemotaxis family, chemotaxis protein CheY
MEINALVIDDSGIMRKMVMRTLEASNLATFVFTEAEDGADGLEKFNPRGTDIVFVDWNMPNMDGMDLVCRLRAQYPERHVPIVMVTTEKLVNKVEEALEYGVDCFISKPFTADGFKKRLGSLIAKIERAQDKPAPGFFQRLMS